MNYLSFLNYLEAYFKAYPFVYNTIKIISLSFLNYYEELYKA